MEPYAKRLRRGSGPHSQSPKHRLGVRGQDRQLFEREAWHVSSELSVTGQPSRRQKIDLLLKLN